MRFDERSRELRHLLLHLASGQVQGGAPNRLRPTAKGADALLHDTRIAVMDGDVLEWHPKLVGQHLSEGRLVPLAVR